MRIGMYIGYGFCHLRLLNTFVVVPQIYIPLEISLVMLISVNKFRHNPNRHTLSGESAKVCVTRTQVIRLSTSCRMAKYMQLGLAVACRGKKQVKFSSLCKPWVRPIIHYTLLYVLRV